MIPKVTWNDQDIADAFVDKGKSHGVTISPETAMELAKQVRSKIKQGDELEVTSVVKDIIEELFPKNPEEGSSKASLDVLTIISNRIRNYKKRILTAQENGPIGSEEEEELRAGVLNDVIIPLQEGIKENAANATRKLLRELLPLQKEKNEIEAYLKEQDKIIELYEKTHADPKDRGKSNLYKKEGRERDKKIRRAIEVLNQINVIKSKLILLDAASGYLKRDLHVMDQYRGVDGITRYFEKVLEPTIKNIKDVVMKVRKNIVLPEVEAKERHSREWILRHHLTKSYQGGNIPPNLDTLTLDEFKESPVYEELRKEGVTDQKISTSLEHLDSLPMTWRKGHAIYMLLDPPAEKTIRQDIPTMITDAPPAWGKQIITNQPFNIEKGKFDEQKGKMEKSTQPKAMSKERKISEAENENAHWSTLFNLTRNQKVDATGKTRAEQYIESLPADVRENEDVLKQAAEMEEEDHLNDKESIYAALWNPSTPDWVLMKAALTGYAENTRRIAKAILQRKRGWMPKLDENGNLVKDEETNDFVWERIPGFQPTAGLDRDNILTAQVAAPPAPMSPSQQQAVGTQNSLQNQINSKDTQIKSLQQQIQQLQVQKTDFEKQRDSVRVPAAPSQPAAATNPPAQTNTGMPPAQPMASQNISFRKFSDMYGWTDTKSEDMAKKLDKPDMDLGLDLDTETFEEPTEPEEGDFAYDQASSSLSVVGDKFIGHFVEWSDVENAIREYAKKHHWYPSVWQISDHGNAHLVTDFKYDVEEGSV